MGIIHRIGTPEHDCEARSTKRFGKNLLKVRFAALQHSDLDVLPCAAGEDLGEVRRKSVWCPGPRLQCGR
jgi:hypothetical protein